MAVVLVDSVMKKHAKKIQRSEVEGVEEEGEGEED